MDKKVEKIFKFVIFFTNYGLKLANRAEITESWIFNYSKNLNEIIQNNQADCNFS